MAGTQDLDNPRPSSQHRPNALSVNSYNQNRPHAHSVSAGTLNPNYRVNRRKSSSSMAGVNIAALAAAAREAAGDKSTSMATLREGPSETVGMPTRPENFPKAEAVSAALHSSSHADKGSSALIDGPPLSALGDKSVNSKVKARRASEGARLARTDRRRSTAGELRCDKCGKGYKHGSCLQKHLWEHTPEWSLTSKLLISKHQQVQLLEAASVLVNMNQDGPAGAESAIQESESSDSPPAEGSGSDPPDDDAASSRTSTPSQLEERGASAKRNAFRRPRRQDSYNSAYSRSYQSTSGHSFAASSAPNEAGYLYDYPRSSSNRRPSNASHHEIEDPDLNAAAASLVSCSLGTPKYGPSQLPADIPPVPPLPAKFQQSSSRPISYGYQTDVEMSDGESHMRYDQSSHGRDDDDEGMFGAIEEHT